MVLEKKPFRKYDEKPSKSDIISVWLGSEDRKMLEASKKIIEQEKDGTAIKQLAQIGYAFLIGDKPTGHTLQILFKNKRNNRRMGIVTFDQDL